MRTLTLSALLVTLVTTSAAAAEPGATGKFLFRDVEYIAVHAVAWRTGGDYPSTQIAVSDKPFDPAAIAADGVVSDADLSEHAGASLTISFMPEDKHVLGITLRNETGHGADFRCEGSGLLTVSSDEESLVTGSFSCEEHQITFTAPVLSTPGQ
jgi:hypothetical protein